MGNITQQAEQAIQTIKDNGLWKNERAIQGTQNTHVKVAGREFINLCANNYLNLADHPALIKAAHQSLDNDGFGMASVRFICGTHTIHQQLEAKLAQFLGVEDAILFSSCFDANAGVFEALLGEEDVIISDSLNHASLIDGIRLCKAKRLRYSNNNMDELEEKLKEAQSGRAKLIVTDGVFSMDGIIANLPQICALAEKYGADILVDDSHAVGFVGPNGRGTPELFGVMDKITLLTGTFGKALGGASGGYVAGKKILIGLLRQRARPYLFSNALAPMICHATLTALDIVHNEPQRRAQLWDNATYFREKMGQAGFQLLGAGHAIIPIFIGDAHRAVAFAQSLNQNGVYVSAFSYPVVPMGMARIRTQMTAGFTQEQLQRVISIFTQCAKECGIL